MRIMVWSVWGKVIEVQYRVIQSAGIMEASSSLDAIILCYAPNHEFQSSKPTTQRKLNSLIPASIAAARNLLRVRSASTSVLVRGPS